MDLGIKDKVALVTGAARGIGKACALRLADEGAKVAIIDIIDPKEVVEEIKSAGGESYGFVADVSDPREVDEAVRRIKNQYGPVEILVNNAAVVTTVARLPKMTDMMWNKDISVNLTGAFNTTRAVFADMATGSWGRIVFIGSLAGIMGAFAQSSYAATKMSLVGFARSVALEGGRYGITANVVAPGMIGTEVMKASVSEDMRERVRKRIAMGKEGDPEDVADAVAFLCSELAGYITGQVLPVSGGLDLLVLPM